MARTPSKRETYDLDATRIMGLIQAIQIDTKATPQWKDKIKGLLYDVTSMLTMENQRRQAPLKVSQKENAK